MKAALPANEVRRPGAPCPGDPAPAERHPSGLELRHHWPALEQAPAMVVVTNLSGNIEYVNPKFVETTGYSVAEAVGQNPRLLKSGRHAPAFYQAIWDTLLRGEVWQGELCNRKKNGELYWVLASISPVRAAEGEMTHFIAVKVDITARHRAAEELQQTVEALRCSERLLQPALNALPAQITILDEQGVIIAVNAALSQFAGQNPFLGGDFGIGANYLSLCEAAAGSPAAEAAAVANGIRSVMAGQCGGFLREYACRSPREKYWFSVRVTRFDTGGPVRVVVVHENITVRKQAEEELKQTQVKLLHASRLAGMAEVATGVLHNVRNVISSVNVSTGLVASQLKQSKIAGLARVADLLREHASELGEFLARDPQGQNLLPYLGQLADHLMQDQAVLLKELGGVRDGIEHIRDIVTLQQGYAKMNGAPEVVRAGELVEDALRVNAGWLERHAVEVVRDYIPEQLPEIKVARHKVLQILVNLIRNAKQACDQSGRPDKRLAVRVTNGDDRVRISVIDNGVGILAGDLPRLFTFGFTTREDGHGFGLHSSVLAAREMGGTLHAHSDGPGQGATFTLELPVANHVRQNL